MGGGGVPDFDFFILIFIYVSQPRSRTHSFILFKASMKNLILLDFYRFIMENTRHILGLG